MAQLEAIGVRKEYVRERLGDSLVALDDISVTVADGSFVTIVGPSGCGKSTFLNIVDGLAPATRGEVLVDGRRVVGPGRDRAVVFQDASLMPWFTVERNIGYGLECQGVSRHEIPQRVQPFLEMVGLTGFEHYYPHELSGGMQQRVNLARALAVDPQVLLMDEPFAALDPQTRELMQGELLRIWEQSRKTVLFITHSIGEAVYLSDRVVVMSARPGRIIADVSIDIPKPRALDVKRTHEYHELEDYLWSLLQTEAQASMASEAVVRSRRT